MHHTPPYYIIILPFALQTKDSFHYILSDSQIKPISAQKVARGQAGLPSVSSGTALAKSEAPLGLNRKRRAKSNVNSKKYTKRSGGPDAVSETAKIQSKIQILLSRIPRLLFIFNFLFVYLLFYFCFFIYQRRSEAEKQNPPPETLFLKLHRNYAHKTGRLAV
jgi:hypothetical protein